MVGRLIGTLIEFEGRISELEGRCRRKNLNKLTELLTEFERDEDFLEGVEEEELIELNHLLALVSVRVSDQIFRV